MEREGQIGKKPEDSGQEKISGSDIWRGFNAWLKRTPLEVRASGIREGKWPEGTPGFCIDIYTKTTRQERLLANIFGDFPSIEEIQARPADYVEKKNQERRERLIKRLGEPEDTTATPEELEERRTRLLKEQIEEIVTNSLTERERQVLRDSFGLNDGRPRTQKEIGENIGKSPRTVGRIKKEALEKLRRPSRSRKIKDYLE